MENIQSGSIPPTGRIEFDGNQDQWSLLAKGLLKELLTTALITVSENPVKRIRVKIRITKVGVPEEYLPLNPNGSNFMTNDADLAKKAATLMRLRNYFIDYGFKRMWLLTGFIEGRKNIPLMIMHLETVNVSIYSVIKDEEEIQKLFPFGMHSGMN